MNNEQVIDFIKQIEKDYKDFNLTEQEYEVWKDTLSKLDYDIAKAKYEEHKQNSEFNKKAPDVKYFIFAKEEKSESSKKYLMKCQECGVVYYNEAMQRHQDRHRSIRYFKKKYLEFWKTEIDYKKEKELLEMKQEQFDNIYDDLLNKIYKVTKNEREKRNIANILGIVNTEVQIDYKKIEG